MLSCPQSGRGCGDELGLAGGRRVPVCRLPSGGRSMPNPDRDHQGPDDRGEHRTVSGDVRVSVSERPCGKAVREEVRMEQAGRICPPVLPFGHHAGHGEGVLRRRGAVPSGELAVGVEEVEERSRATPLPFVPRLSPADEAHCEVHRA